jgi:hypothetical protein
MKLVTKYNFFILEVVQAWVDPTQKRHRTIHHQGEGVFMVPEDPRLGANVELGGRIFSESSSRDAALVAGFGSGALNRDEWIAMFETVVKFLEGSRSLRQKLPREQVSPVTLPDHLQGGAAVVSGHFSDVQTCFQRNSTAFLNPSAL